MRFSWTQAQHTCSVSVNERERAMRCKNYANIEEMIADGGFGFHAKVKSVS